MAIVRMKRLRAIALAPKRDELLLELQRLGCVELSAQDDFRDDPALAARYAEVIATLRRLTDVDIQRLHVIGGGSRNEFLMQFTADAIGMPVIAGPQEGTALGNVLAQMKASHLVSNLKQMRAVVANSIEFRTYMPANHA